jgi:hypothetical protein
MVKIVYYLWMFYDRSWILNFYTVKCKKLWSESVAVNWKWTDNAMTKRKRKKQQTMIYKTLYRKLRIELHEPHIYPQV